MEDKKITTTEEQLRILSCVATCETIMETGVDEDVAMRIAARINAKIIDHLTGRKKFDEKIIHEIKKFDSVLNVLDVIMESIAGGLK
jgi:protein gp37